jgi:cysteinyl-tRNA synthetase
MKLYNSLTKKIEEIKPLKPGVITMYNCGPTVYWRMHVGNLRAYAEWDVLHRAFLYLGYDVKRVMNFTDVGHMTDDEDFGEDKVEQEASEKGKKPSEIANFYIRTVIQDFYKMNYLSPSGDIVHPDIDIHELGKYGWARATEYIDEIIEFIKKIEANDFTYETDKALYFDVTKYDDYSRMFKQDLKDKKIGAREEVEVDSQKKNPADFVLWMKKVGKYEKHIMSWDSPWGVGFPGWHIECSAMSCDILGEKFDIHTGGIDHIPIHHTNERAQNFGAFKHEVCTYWVHNEFIRTPKNEKLSKSKGNALTLDEVTQAGIEPMDLRYHYVSVNYRVPLQFNWEALEGSRRSRLSLIKKISELKSDGEGGNLLNDYVERFEALLKDNLNVSGVFALISELLKSNEKAADIVQTVLDFDRVLGLDLAKALKEKEQIPKEVEKLLEERKRARQEKDFEKSDSLRDEIAKHGFKVLDTDEGQKLERV